MQTLVWRRRRRRRRTILYLQKKEILKLGENISYSSAAGNGQEQILSVWPMSGPRTDLLQSYGIDRNASIFVVFYIFLLIETKEIAEEGGGGEETHADDVPGR
jgi:hypothetical protein